MKKSTIIILVFLFLGTAIFTKMSQLKYPLDKTDQNILRTFLKQELPNLIFDTLWDNVIYWSTFYESPDGWNLTGVPIFVGGELSMTANNNTVAIDKATNNRNFLEWNKDQRMRMNFSLSAVTNDSALMVIGQEQSGGVILSHFGFQTTNSLLQGISGDATTAAQSTIDLKTIVAGTTYEIEARYSYPDKILFYIDGVTVGTLTTNLPKTNNDAVDDYNPEIVEIVVTSSAVANKTFISSFFEYIRLK